MEGGKLMVTLGSQPKKEWGIENTSPSMSNEEHKNQK